MFDNNPNITNIEIAMPDNLIDIELIEKVDDKFSKNSLIMDSIEEYVNSSIMNFTFGGIKIPVNDQVSGNKLQKYQTSLPTINNITETTIVIEFRMLDGCINYWLHWLTMYNRVKNKKSNRNIVGNFTFVYTHSYNDILKTRITLKNCMLNAINDLELNFSDDGLSYKSYTLELSFEDIDFDIK